ncbi:MAG TPA: hypothetical protein VGZ02_08000 [Candidatus Baltobacteraceae bacterium]|jgi:hypothetical protein|nr:hypothetical protein [Candidatus Baltobacteraceae bacterium]
MQAETRTREGQSDFDFLFGRWTVRNRRLRHPLSGSEEWYDFDASYRAIPLWDGKANLDEFIADTPYGRIEGLTLRLYDAATATWSLYWATSKNGLIVVPNVGAFNGGDGFGEFFSRETFDGRPIVCRYRWTKECEHGGCRWEQAFSPDDGATWETNWIMEFTRA